MISLLDCTLRDGGYVNDWNFGYSNLVNVFERLADSNVDMIEIGFLDERREFDINRSIMPNTESANKIYGHLNKKNSMVVAMIDYGTCGLENIQPVDRTCIGAIRVIFKKHLRVQALEFCAQIKALGYKVFAQLVSVTSYSDEEMLDLIRLANEVEPYAVSIVDTYGLMHQNNLSHYYDLLNDNLKQSISIGYHGHNNFQMGYANCICMIEKANDTERDLIIDGTLYGMGKSAGNAPIELIVMYLNRMSPKRYNVDQMLEAIDSNILQFYSEPTWGYNLFFYIAASNDCHPNYVSFLLRKRTLSIKSVNEILRKLSLEKALLYDEQYIEKLYIEYQTNTINDASDYEQLRSVFSGRDVLLVGPEDLNDDNLCVVIKYIKEKKPIIVTINCIPDQITPDYVFLCNSKRYIQLASMLSQDEYKIIATSNLTKTGKNEFGYVLNYASLLEKAPIVADSAMVMIFKVLKNLECSSVALAGLEGYTNSTAIQFSNEEGADKIINISTYINDYIHDFIFNTGIENIKFLTASKFEKKDAV